MKNLIFLILGVVFVSTYAFENYVPTGNNECPAQTLGVKVFHRAIAAANPFAFPQVCYGYCGSEPIFIGVEPNNCLCYYRDDGNGSPKCNGAKTKEIKFWAPKFIITPIFGDFQYSGVSSHSDDRYNKLNLFQEASKSPGKFAYKSIRTFPWWGRANNRSPINRITYTRVESEHRRGWGPQMDLLFHAKLKVSSSFARQSLSHGTVFLMRMLAARLRYKHSNTKVDGVVKYDQNSGSYKTISEEAMYSTPTFIRVLLWDMSQPRNEKFVAEYSFDEGIRKTHISSSKTLPLLPHLQCSSASQQLDMAKDSLTAFGLPSSRGGKIASAVGVFYVIPMTKCSKLSLLTEAANTTLFENRLSFCNSTKENSDLLDSDDLDMCNRILWKPKEWFSEVDEERLAQLLLPDCTSMDDKPISDLVSTYGLNHTDKINRAQSLCKEMASLGEDITENPFAEQDQGIIVGGSLGAIAVIGMAAALVAWKVKSSNHKHQPPSHYSNDNPLFVHHSTV